MYHTAPFLTPRNAQRSKSVYFPSNPMDRQFPPEVVVLIVEASLDPYDSFDMLDDHIPRYSTLCNYSRLNSVWRNISKPLLYESVVVTTDKAGEALLEIIEGGEGDEMGMVRSLRVYDTEEGVTMRRLVKRMSAQVELLALEGAHFGHFPIANRLRRLFLRACYLAQLVDPTDPGALLQLQYLQIEESGLAYDLGTPQSLPSLRSLSLTDSEDVDIPPALLNTLTALHLDNEGACRRFLPHTKNLILLSISTDYSDAAAFLLLDTIPRYVRLARHPLYHALIALEYHVSSGKSGLETIFWDEREADRDEDEPDECEARIAGQVRLLSGKGIKVIRGNISFRNAVERVDAILAKEKRAAEKKAAEW